MSELLLSKLDELSEVMASLKIEKEKQWLEERINKIRESIKVKRGDAKKYAQDINQRLVGMGSLSDIPPHLFGQKNKINEFDFHALVKAVGAKLDEFCN